MSVGLEQAVDRIQYAVDHEPDRRLVFVTGSGLSLPAIPSTEGMVDYFLAEIGSSTVEFDKSTSPATQYQLAANELRQRRGETGLARAVRKAVLSAYNRPIQSLDRLRSLDELEVSGWRVPDSQRKFAQFLRSVPRHRLGPIFTLNFDPLTEVALADSRLSPTSIAVPATQAINLEGIHNALPVVHIHGYWLSSATLSTSEQLKFKRPKIEEMLRQQMQDSLVIVLGVGGWEDSFLRALRTLLDDGSLSMLRAEVLWMLHGNTPVSEHPFLSAVHGSASLNVYSDVHAATLLARLTPDQVASDGAKPSLLGWSYASDSIAFRNAPDQDAIIAFFEGAQPTFAIASSLPLLENTKVLKSRALELLHRRKGGIVLVSGPTGEGKSLGLIQISQYLCESKEDVEVLFRKPGAPTITTEFLRELVSTIGRVVLVIDEGDLAVESYCQAVRELETTERSKITSVIAMHSHYKERAVRAIRLARLPLEEVQFADIESKDADHIATAWKTLGVLPQSFSATTTREIAAMIMDSATSAQGRSLFAAAFDLWMGEELWDRIDELLTRLGRSALRGISMRHILGAIALVQIAWDPREERGMGLSTSVIGSMLGVGSDDVLGLVVRPLGHEVGISVVGQAVYVRHEAIARAIVDCLDEPEQLDIAFNVGYHGGRLRADAYRSTSSSSRSAFLLGRRLPSPVGLAACRGAVEATPGLIESRVSFFATCRDTGHLHVADQYAERMSRDLKKYKDYWASARGFFVEWSTVKKRLREPRDALGLALLSLTDLERAQADSKKLIYGLTSAYALSRSLVDDNLSSTLGALLAIFRPADREYQAFARSDKSTFSFMRDLSLNSLLYRPQGLSQYPWQFQALSREVSRVRGELS